MVIQRSWKILSDAGSTSPTEANRSPPGPQPSSDDSDCSNQTTHSMVTSISSPPATKVAAQAPTMTSYPEPEKYVTTPQMAEAVLQRLKQRLSCPVSVAGTGATPESAMRSLELLRISVQQAFDIEVNMIVKRYMNDYFAPALQNIKENLGQNAVSVDMLQKMSCALLENAKAQYNAFRMKPQFACVGVTSSDNFSLESSSLRIAIKRPAVKPIDMNELPKKHLPPVVVQHHREQPTSCGLAKVPVSSTSSIAEQKSSGSIPNAPVRRQIFWNTAHISTITKFVLDVQANQAFGFGTDGKERLASKHPELIRYLPDSEDRDWLIGHNIIAAQNRNSRFLFLIHDEVCRLPQTHDIYRSKPNIDLSVMHTFCVPDFMIQKMKLFFVDLNIKSRGLITNSFSVGAAQSGSHLRNALLQGIQVGGNGVNTTGNGGGEAFSTTALVPAAETTVTYTNAITTVATTSDNVSSGQQSKPSTLSSSHATLTALLNNSASASDKTATVKLRK